MMTKSIAGRVAAVAVGALLLAGCGSAQQHIAPIQDVDARLAPTEEGDFEALAAEAERHWANRSQRSEVEAAIATWERMLRVPTSGDRRRALYPVLHQLGRAYYFLADAHLQFDRSVSQAELKTAYEKGIDWSRLALSVNNPDWNRALLYERPIPEAVQVTTRADLPAMYWYSTNLGRWAIMDGTPTILAHKDDIAAIMGRVLELDGDYFWAAADRYFGVFYTRVPVGNPDLDRSRQHFEAAIRRAPDYLSTRVLFAQDYATKAQNRALYVEQLEYVLNADVAAIPEVQPENEVEQLKARRLLDDVDEYFR
jgi:tetratricopeptide (TPR) repeat protein